MASQPPNPNANARSTLTRNAGPKTLVGVVGLLCATLLFNYIPQDESGRKVAVIADPKTEQVTIVNLSGPQYLKVYLDMVGVATVCDGLTGPDVRALLKAGGSLTPAQCTKMLEIRLIQTAEQVKVCAPELWYPGTDYIRYSSISLGYNIGTPTACKSTSFKLIRQGKYPSGCDAAKKFDMAGGQHVKGLRNRRGREWEACVTTLLPGKTPETLKARMAAWK